MYMCLQHLFSSFDFFLSFSLSIFLNFVLFHSPFLFSLLFILSIFFCSFLLLSLIFHFYLTNLILLNPLYFVLQLTFSSPVFYISTILPIFLSILFLSLNVFSFRGLGCLFWYRISKLYFKRSLPWIVSEQGDMPLAGPLLRGNTTVPRAGYDAMTTVLELLETDYLFL